MSWTAPVVQQIPVLAQPHAVADAVRAAVVQSLRDGGRAVRLAGVHRAVDVVVQDELERFLVVLGRVSVFRSSQIEAEDAAVLVGDRELGESQRDLRAHVADAADEDPGEDPRLPGGRAEPLEDRLHDHRGLEPLLQMEHGRVANLDQLAVLRGGVDGQLVRGAIEGVLRLQDAEGDVEPLQVLLEAAVPLADLH